MPGVDAEGKEAIEGSGGQLCFDSGLLSRGGLLLQVLVEAGDGQLGGIRILDVLTDGGVQVGEAFEGGIGAMFGYVGKNGKYLLAVVIYGLLGNIKQTLPQDRV